MSAENKYKKEASIYFKGGLNIVPFTFFKKNDVWEKKPIIKWQRLQTEKQTEEEFENLPWKKAQGFGVVLGKATNGQYFCAIELDVKKLNEEVVKLGRKVMDALPEAYSEETINKGLRTFFFSKEEPKTDESFHDVCGVSVLGVNKLCIMWPSEGYKTLVGSGDYGETENANTLLKETVEKCKIEIKKEESWFDLGIPKGKGYRGHHPNCIVTLRSAGVPEGQRNNVSMRLFGYFLHCRRISDSRTWTLMKEWNEKNSPPFTEEELRKKMEEVKRGAYNYGCEDSILKSVCTHKKKCAIWRARSKGTQIEFVSRTPSEMIASALRESKGITLHPIIDFPKEIGYSVGCFLSEENLLQIINKNVEVVCLADNPVELRNSKQIVTINPISIRSISGKLKENLLNIAGDIQSGKEIENKGRNEVFSSILDKVKYYFFHSEKKWYLFASCFIIATYYHRLFLVFPHWVLQGQRETGKTTMGMLLRQLCWNPTPLSSNLNPAPIFRRCEDTRCTHLADLTRVSYKNSELIDIYEAIEPDFAVSRCVGPEKDQVKDFYPFSPKALMVRRDLPFGAKTIECVTEKSPKGSPYTKRRREISIDPDMKGIVGSILRSVICNWKDVYEAYKETKQDDKLFGRRFELWQPFLAVCKVYSPDRYNELLELAYEDARKSEMGDFTSDVEDALLGYLLTYAEGGKKSQVFLQKKLKEELQNILGDRVVKSYHIVKSAIKNLKVCKKKPMRTTQGIKLQIDLEKVSELAKEKNIKRLETVQEEAEQKTLDFCVICGDDLHDGRPLSNFDGRPAHSECVELELKETPKREKKEVSSPETTVDFCAICGDDLHDGRPLSNWDGRDVHSECKEIIGVSELKELKKEKNQKITKEGDVSQVDEKVEKKEPPTQDDLCKDCKALDCPQTLERINHCRKSRERTNRIRQFLKEGMKLDEEENGSQTVVDKEKEVAE